METWFKLREWFDEIEPVEVEKTTENSVWINGCRHSKLAGFENYFKTRKEAAEFLLELRVAKLENAKRNLDHARSNLESVRAKFAKDLE